MNIEYSEVPNIISSKDLDYLTDMFNWNYRAYKNSYNAISKVNDKEIKDMLEKYLEYQKEVYELIFRKGWYMLKKAQVNDINTKFQELNQEMNNINC